MIHVRRGLFVGLLLLASQLSTGCYLGLTTRPVLFPSVAVTPTRPLLGGGCCGSLLGGPLAGAPAAGPGYGYGGPVHDAPIAVSSPVGYDHLPDYGGGAPGCTTCNSGGPVVAGHPGIPIAGTVGGPPIAVSPPGGTVVPAMPAGPTYGPHAFPTGPTPGGVTPFDSSLVPTVTPPTNSVPLQMPKEKTSESKKLVAAGK
jgi:hypothetical protein